MKQEEKQLLRKDLCARLPYGVMVHEKWEYQNPGVEERTKKEEDHVMNCYDLASITTIKPYLRPMSSMTEEEKKEYIKIAFPEKEDGWGNLAYSRMGDFYNAHHFDYRGLIPMGLALEAPEDMYKQ